MRPPWMRMWEMNEKSNIENKNKNKIKKLKLKFYYNPDSLTLFVNPYQDVPTSVAFSRMMCGTSCSRK